MTAPACCSGACFAGLSAGECLVTVPIHRDPNHNNGRIIKRDVLPIPVLPVSTDAWGSRDLPSAIRGSPVHYIYLGCFPNKLIGTLV